jgi:hypothetical protein
MMKWAAVAVVSVARFTGGCNHTFIQGTCVSPVVAAQHPIGSRYAA